MSHMREDCYFFFNSICTKGDRCRFRHCAAAKRSKKVCRLWLQDRCFKKACRFRHTEIKKIQREIQCRWEKQEGVCRKQGCNFKHRKQWTIRRRRDPPAKKDPAEKRNKITSLSDVAPGQTYKRSGSVCPDHAEQPHCKRRKINKPGQCKKEHCTVNFNHEKHHSYKWHTLLLATDDEIDFIIKALEELKLEDSVKTHLRTAISPSINLQRRQIYFPDS